MQKYFINKIVDDIVSLTKNDEHHLINVLRVKEDDEFIAIKDNKKYLCQIISINPLRSKIIQEIKQDTTNNFIINVFQASIKPNHMEIAIIKACELNVNNFYIFNANYSQHNIVHNLERYKKLIKEASEQSNRNNLMNIEIINSNQNLKQKLEENDLNLLAHLENSNQSIGDILKPNNTKIGIIIGPEGGFSDIDLELFKSDKTKSVLLTKTILRAETAMIYLTSVVSYFMIERVNNEKNT